MNIWLLEISFPYGFHIICRADRRQGMQKKMTKSVYNIIKDAQLGNIHMHLKANNRSACIPYMHMVAIYPLLRCSASTALMHHCSRLPEMSFSSPQDFPRQPQSFSTLAPSCLGLTHSSAIFGEWVPLHIVAIDAIVAPT